MPKVISDELFDAIVEYGPIYDNNHGPDDDLDLYPVINGLLNRLATDAVPVEEMGIASNWGWYEDGMVYKEFNDAKSNIR